MKDLLQRIRALRTLTPSEETNAAFSELVHRALDPQIKVDLSEQEVFELRNLAAQAEFEMELFWAEKVIASETPDATLKSFWYYKNYQDLTKIEWSALDSYCVREKHDSVLFVGSGPLPMTAIVLAKEYGVSSVLLDTNEAAVAISRKLIHKIGLASMVKVEFSSGEKYMKYSDFEVVYLAALAGVDEEAKNVIVENIAVQSTEHTHLIVRSAHSNRTLLYAPVDIHRIRGFSPILEVHPHNDVVNSVIILKKDARK